MEVARDGLRAPDAVGRNLPPSSSRYPLVVDLDDGDLAGFGRTLTASQINRLGRRLRHAEGVSEEDLELLQRLRRDHFDLLAQVQHVLRSRLSSVSPTTRLKTVQTIVEKLKRERTMALSLMQDIAGARIVEDMNRVEQDVLVSEVSDAVRTVGEVTIVDRRRKPSYGYAAVHLVVQRDRRFVEIQVRTGLQDQWAQIVERLGDLWGRQIRYGEPPNEPELNVGLGLLTRADTWTAVQSMSKLIDVCEATIAENVLRSLPPDDDLTNLMRDLEESMAYVQSAAVAGRL